MLKKISYNRDLTVYTVINIDPEQTESESELVGTSVNSGPIAEAAASEQNQTNGSSSSTGSTLQVPIQENAEVTDALPTNSEADRDISSTAAYSIEQSEPAARLRGLTPIDILEFAQAEGGWERKKIDNYAMGHRHLAEAREAEDAFVYRPEYMAYVLEPINRFLGGMIENDDGYSYIEEINESPRFQTVEYVDSDQAEIIAEMTRLTTCPDAGIISKMDFCQAEGSPHKVEAMQEGASIVDSQTKDESHATVPMSQADLINLL